jgi:hypothetical protein
MKETHETVLRTGDAAVTPGARKRWRGAGIAILANLALPYVIYVQTKARIDRVDALLAASLPPILWGLIEFLRKYRADPLSILALAGIVLSLIGFLGAGSARLLQLRENLIAGLIGLVFLGSAAMGRPLMYHVACAVMARKSQAEAERIQGLRDRPSFRRTMTTMTLVWGFGLLVETGVACVLIFKMPIREYLIADPIIGYGTFGGLVLWSFWYGKHRRRHAAQRAAAGNVGVSP